MAVRPQNTHDGGVAERRLRPIYDWLDNGYNKKALQEAEKVLKKSPTLQAARALKALALLRLGKTTEAHTVLDALADEKPSDDTTLQAMTISYRESNQLQKVCTLYEAAAKAEPTSEELHSHLFMSYVRVGDYKSQQRAAMALYKFAPKNPYYFWAVMSIVLQAKSTDDITKKNILLALAQRMVDNFINDNKMEAKQEAQLYIMILELQEKWEDIVKFLESPLYSKLVPGSMPQESIPYLKKTKQWRRLNLLCKELLMYNQDRWDYYTPYLDSVFELINEPSIETVGESPDDTPEKCHEFICVLVESSSGKTIRGPYLARLELWKRLAEKGDPTTLMGSGVALCIQYLRKFAHKPCVVPDLRTYIDMLSQKERENSCRDFLTCMGFDENSLPGTIDDIQRHVNCIGLWRLCAPPLEPAANLELASTLRQNYLRCLIQGLVTSTQTEFCAADMYAMLAAHHYIYAGLKTKSSQPVMEALCLLELLLHKSPANFHSKLLLVQVYHLLGNALAADTIYLRLEVKHIQLLSLGWLHTARLASACGFTRAGALLADTINFHTHRAKDGAEHLSYAYKYGTFDKLVSLQALQDRLERCQWCRTAVVHHELTELARAELGQCCGDPIDNRDLNVIVNWEPPQLRDKNLKERSYEQERHYLNLKELILESITHSNELNETKEIEAKKSTQEELKGCIDKLQLEFDKCKGKYVPEPVCITSPFPARIIAFVSSPVPYRDLYISIFKLVAELSINDPTSASSCQQIGQEVGQQIEQSLGALHKALEEKSCSDPVWGLRESLEELSNYIEFLNIATHLIGVSHELTSTTHTKKSKKKANQSPDEIKTSEAIRKINQNTQKCISAVEEIFTKLPEYKITSNLEEILASLSLENEYNNNLENRLKNGRQEMILDVTNLLKKMSKYLKTFIH